MLNRYQIQYTDSGAATIQKNLAGIGAAAKGTTAAVAGLSAAMLPLVAVVASFQTLKKTINVIEEFDTTMLEVKAVTRASTQEFNLLSEAARKMGAETRFTASESGQALLALAKIGFDTSQAIAALPATLNLAIAGTLGIERSAEIAAITLKQFGLEVTETTRVTDVFVRAANDSVTGVEGIAQAMSNVGPIARAVGFDLESTTAIIETLISSGLSAPEAGTSLKNILLGLSAPSDMAKAAIESLNLTLNDLDLRKHTLSDIFKTLKQAGIGVGQAEAMFGRLGVVGATTLADYNDQIEIFTKRNKEAAGTAKQTAEIMDSGLKAAFLELSSITEELMLKMGDAGVKQVLTGLTKVATVLVSGLGDLVVNLGKVGEMLGELYLYWETAFWGFVRIAGSTGFALVQTFVEAFNMIYNIGYDVFSNLGTAIFELIHGGSKTKTVPQIFAENWEKSFQNVANGWTVATASIKKEVGKIGDAWDQTDFKSIITDQNGVTGTIEDQSKAAKDLSTVITELSDAEKARLKGLKDAAELYGSFSIKTPDKTFVDAPVLAPVYTGAFSDALNQQTADIKGFAEENADIIDTFSTNVSNSLSDMFTDVGASFSDFMNNLTSDIIRMMTSQYVNQFIGMLSGMGSGAAFTGFGATGFGSYGGDIVNTLSGGASYGLFGMKHALGGEYEAGKPRMTSEYGAEVDIPSHSGRILSRGDAMQALGSGGQPISLKILNQVDDNMILQAMQTKAGERLVVNIISKYKNLIG